MLRFRYGIRTARLAVGPAVACAFLAAVGAGAAAGNRDPTGHRRVVLGRSVEGRAVAVFEVGDLDSPRKALVVGCIHGDECAGTAVAARLAQAPPPPETDLWIVPELNPDGAAAATRGNAHGVDLNRNFPWRWTPLRGTYYSGPRPLSEPETRIAYRLIARERPSLSVWFHQSLDVVDDSTGDRTIERRFARVARLRVAPLTREPGSAVTWESHCFPGATAFVVELPAGTLSRPAVERLVHAVRVAAASAPDRRSLRVRCHGRR